MVGLQNFGFLIEDSTFWLSLWNTVVLFVMSTVPTLVIAMALAVMLHSAVRFKGIYRIAYFIPNITSLVAAAIFFAAVFSTELRADQLRAARRSGCPPRTGSGSRGGSRSRSPR